MTNTEAPALRPTRQRKAVAAVLAECSEFRTAQQVHESLRSAGDNVGLSTVYRALQAMADAGEIDVLRSDAGEAAYRRCSDSHHHHLVCRSCGATVEVEGPAVEKWTLGVAEKHGFRAVSHTLEIFGTCARC
ncbi:MAG: transcriptional repressor [Propionibacteriales bacterium]|nr:transcriptional repressor [Propionibacteriales bacterium]